MLAAIASLLSPRATSSDDLLLADALQVPVDRRVGRGGRGGRGDELADQRVDDHRGQQRLAAGDDSDGAQQVGRGDVP